MNGFPRNFKLFSTVVDSTQSVWQYLKVNRKEISLLSGIAATTLGVFNMLVGYQISPVGY